MMHLKLIGFVFYVCVCVCVGVASLGEKLKKVQESVHFLLDEINMGADLEEGRCVCVCLVFLACSKFSQFAFIIVKIFSLGDQRTLTFWAKYYIFGKTKILS